MDAFFAAAHSGDLDALVAVLDPDVVARIDGGTAYPDASVVLHGAAAVASRTLTIAQPTVPKLPVLVNEAAGVVGMLAGQPAGVIGFTVSGERSWKSTRSSTPRGSAGSTLADLGS